MSGKLPSIIDANYEYLVMPFDFRNAPVVSQRFINNVFHVFLGRFIIIYLDNIPYFYFFAQNMLRMFDCFLLDFKKTLCMSNSPNAVSMPPNIVCLFL